MQKKKQEWRPLTDRLTQAKDGQHPILARKKRDQAEPSNATDGCTDSFSLLGSFLALSPN